MDHSCSMLDQECQNNHDTAYRQQKMWFGDDWWLLLAIIIGGGVYHTRALIMLCWRVEVGRFNVQYSTWLLHAIWWWVLVILWPSLWSCDDSLKIMHVILPWVSAIDWRTIFNQNCVCDSQIDRWPTVKMTAQQYYHLNICLSTSWFLFCGSKCNVQPLCKLADLVLFHDGCPVSFCDLIKLNSLKRKLVVHLAQVLIVLSARQCSS